MLSVVQDEQREDDYVTEISGIKIYVAEMLIKEFGGFSIDYSSFFLMRGYMVMPREYSKRC